MKKRFLLVTALAAVTALGVSSAVILNRVYDNNDVRAKDAPRLFTLDDSNGLENSSIDLTTNLIQSHINDFIPFQYVLGQAMENGHATLLPHGCMYNYGGQSSDGLEAIHGIVKISAKFTGGDLFLTPYKDAEGKIAGPRIALTSETEVTITKFRANYFKLEAGDSAVDIESVDIKADCSNDRLISDLSVLEKTYTGVANSVGYKLDVDAANSSVTVSSMNLEENFSYTLSADLSCNVLTLTDGEVNDVVFDLSADLSALTYNAGESDTVLDLDGLVLKAVYSVEDYEGYSATGNGYDASHAITAMSGLRSAYHADYYNTGAGTASLFRDPNWKLMGSSDYLTLAPGMGVGGSKCGVFKSNSNGLRYVSMNSFYPTHALMGKGNTFSFWAHSAVSSLSTPTSNGKDTAIKVRLFYKSAIQKCDDTTGVATTVTIPASSDWAHYEIPLDTTKQFYGYSFYLNNSTNGYVPIDNIEVYSTDPYMEYEAPKSASIDGVYYTSAEISALSQTHSVMIALDKSGKATVKVSGVDAGATAYTYDSTTHEVSIPTTGSVPTYGFTYGTITATLNETTGVLEDLNFDGTAGSYVTNNGSLVANRPANVWDCEGTTGDLQTVFKRRYDGGSGWQTDTGNTDRIVANSNAAVGETSLKFRMYGGAGHKTALALNSDISLQNVSNLGFFILNDTGVEFSLSMFIYKAAGMQSNSQIGTVTIPASSEWKFVQCGFGSSLPSGSTLYNFQLYVQTPTGQTANFYPSFDNICIW